MCKYSYFRDNLLLCLIRYNNCWDILLRFRIIDQTEFNNKVDVNQRLKKQ